MGERTRKISNDQCAMFALDMTEARFQLNRIIGRHVSLEKGVWLGGDRDANNNEKPPVRCAQAMAALREASELIAKADHLVAMFQAVGDEGAEKVVKLSPEDLEDLYNLAIDARLYDLRDDLWAHIEGLKSGIQQKGSPGLQLRRDLNYLNYLHYLCDDGPPLIRWITNAMALTDGYEATQAKMQAYKDKLA